MLLSAHRQKSFFNWNSWDIYGILTEKKKFKAIVLGIISCEVWHEWQSILNFHIAPRHNQYCYLALEWVDLALEYKQVPKFWKFSRLQEKDEDLWAVPLTRGHKVAWCLFSFLSQRSTSLRLEQSSQPCRRVPAPIQGNFSTSQKTLHFPIKGKNPNFIL